jgi:hypothetical protein
VLAGTNKVRVGVPKMTDVTSIPALFFAIREKEVTVLPRVLAPGA